MGTVVKGMLDVGIGVAALFHPAMLALAVAAGTASEEAQLEALYTWEVALTRFQEAGALIGAGDYDRAKAALSAIAQELPRPYSRTAMECRQRIGSGPRERMTLHGYYYFGGLGKACLELHAHKEAVELWRQAVEAHPRDHNRIRSRIAWCLLESGAIEDALVEYRKRLAGCKLSDMRRYYETQIELITQRQEKQEDASFAKEYIRKHYLPTHPSFRKDYLGALKELKRVLPYAKDEGEQTPQRFQTQSRRVCQGIRVQRRAGTQEEEARRSTRELP
jgi:tetratricopeptide (TPR) repeat protein